MFEIIVSDEIKEACPQLQLGFLLCQVVIHKTNDLFWSVVENTIRALQKRLDLTDIHKIPAIQSTRHAYKKLGKDPSRYRSSAEALLRRVVKEKGLYRLNSTVDIINLVSLESGYSIGGYDFPRISGTITLKKGDKNDHFQAIGRDELNITNLPVLYDELGPFGSPTSDSIRTGITLSTKQVLLVFFDFSRNESLSKWIDRAIYLLKQYTDARQVQTKTLKY